MTLAGEAPSSEVPDTVEPLLQVEGLTKTFDVGTSRFGRSREEVKAVTEVSFHLNAGETLGLVGESGCGKSTTARLLMGLTEPTSGRIVFDGKDITRLNRSDRVAVRRQMQMVYQDPFSSVNPRMTVRDIVMEPMLIHEGVETDPEGRLQYLLEMVGLGPRYKSRYPHQLSGGQLQRVGIARALALDPQILILDEPVSALDVSIQAQILGLLQDLQEELGVAFLFVAHDLGVVRHVSDRVAVMYLGRVVETGTRDQVYESAAHPYTQALLSSVPVADPRMRTKSRRILLTGDPPSPTNIPSGCAFRNRCWRAEDVCAVERPLLESRTGVAHPAACHFASSSLDARQSRGNEGGTV